MRILITGATGFVGTHLRTYLLQHTEWEIVGTSYPDQPPVLLKPAREQLIYLDLRDVEATRSALAMYQPAYIVHLAAQSHVPTAYKNPWGTLENNILCELNLLESCRTLEQPPRVLIIGSGDEYGRGDPGAMPLTEDAPLCPENPYSVSKVTQDVLGYQYFISYGLPVLRVRPFNHIGPHQSPRFVLPSFAQQIAQIEAQRRPPVMLVGNLTPARDFTDVRDVVRAYHQLLLRGIPGEVYNVASGEAHTIRSLLDRLLVMASVEIRVETDPMRYRPADVPIVYGSFAKLQHDTGWSPQIPFAQTVADVLTEWRAHYGLLTSI